MQVLDLVVIAVLAAGLAVLGIVIRRQRRRLDEFEERHRQVLESISDRVAFIDPDFKLVWSNRSDDDGAGLSPSKPCYKAIGHVVEPCEGCPVPRVLATGQPAEGEVVDRHGSVHRIVAAPVFDRQQRLLGVVQTSRDITEKRRLAQRLQQAEKLKAVGQLAAGVAHDFNNSLQVILGYAELLEESLAEQPEVGRLVAPIRRAAEQTQGVVGQLLTFSRRPGSGRKPVDLAAVTAAVVDRLSRELEAGTTIALSLSDDLPPVEADALQVEEVLENLCRNAVDAMPEGGRIEVSLANRILDDAGDGGLSAPRIGQYVVMSVTDQGAGIAADVRRRIFEPFFTTKAVDRGSGLGLAAVHGIVMQHGGYIDVDSRPDAGTTVLVGWPCEVGKDEASIISEASTSPSSCPGGTG